MYHTAQLKTEMALKTEKIPPQNKFLFGLKVIFCYLNTFFDDYYINYYILYKYYPGLGRIFQTRHGSEIQCVSVSDIEPDIARIKKAQHCGPPRRF